MKKNISYLLFITLMILPSFSQSKKQLEEILDRYEKQYLSFKSQSVLDRDKMDKEMNLLDEQINQLYNSKNIISQEYYVISDNVDGLEDSLQSSKENRQTYNSRIVEVIDQSKKKTRSLYPSMVEKSLLRLKEQGESVQRDTFNASYDYLKYREFLLDEGQKIITTNTTIVDAKNQKIGVKELRLGYIHDSYVSDDGESAGFLVSKMTLLGPSFLWQNVNKSLESKLNNSIFELYNAEENNEGYVYIPIDVGDAGDKLEYFYSEDDEQNVVVSIFSRFIIFFNSGGILMYPLFFLALFSILIGIERILFFKRNLVLTSDNNLKKIMGLTKEGKEEEAKKICQDQNNILGYILYRFIHEKISNRKQAENVLEEELVSEVPKLEKRLSTLSMVAAIAPLMGLLGTVAGMIALFNVITVYGSNNPKILAGGISIALVTTQTGLAIAIPVVILQHVLTRFKNGIVYRVEVSCSRFLNSIYPS